MGLSPDSVAARWGCELISQEQCSWNEARRAERRLGGGLPQQDETGLSSVIVFSQNVAPVV